MATQIRTSVEVFNQKTSTGEWTIEAPPTYWNGFNAMAIIRYMVGKKITEAKVIIAKYYM